MGIPAEALLPFIFGSSGGGGGGGDSTYIPTFGSLATISTGTSWSGDDPYTATVTVTGYTVTNKTMVNVLPSSDVVEQMIEDGTTNIFITNNSGTLTATAIGAAPTAAMTLQVLCTESDVSEDIAGLPAIVGNGIFDTLEANNLTDAVNQLSNAISQLDGKLLTDGIKSAFLNCFSHVAWKDEEGQNAYNALQSLFDGGVYGITNLLTNCVTSNNATVITANDSYTATISCASEYALPFADVSITMGGVDITSTAYSNGVISINHVTGDIVIDISVADGYTLYGYIGQSGVETEAIITDIAMSTDYSFLTEIYWQANSAAGFIPLCGVRSSPSGEKEFGLFINRPTGQIGYWINGVDTQTQITGITGSQKHNFAVLPVGKSETYPNNSVIVIDGVEYNSTSTSTGKTFNPWLTFFGYGTEASSSVTTGDIGARFGEVVIIGANNTVLHDLIPANNGTYNGFYDIVADKFYYSATNPNYVCGNW